MAKRGSVDVEKCTELNDLEENRVSECGKDVQPNFLDMITEVVSHPTVRRLWSFFMVLFVLGTIQSITICGAVYIYPQFLDPNEASFYVHWCLCLCFWANTNLNYAEAVLRDPGFVGPSECGAAGDFCQRCQQGKPAGSHHCRICRRCVQNMDHHCPFIGNCVGRSNRKAFVLFLFWSASSLAYVLTITTIYCFDHSEAIVKHVHEAIDHLPPLKSTTLAFYLHRLINHKYVGIHLHAVGFLLLLGSVTFLMTFSLLIQQIRLICEGQTTISRLQAQRPRGKHLSKSTKTCLQNWQDVFGGPWCCFLPRIPFFEDFFNRPAKHVWDGHLLIQLLQRGCQLKERFLRGEDTGAFAVQLDLLWNGRRYCEVATTIIVASRFETFELWNRDRPWKAKSVTRNGATKTLLVKRCHQFDLFHD